MKKVLAILVIAMFLGGITAPAFASNNSTLITMSNVDDDPKKAKKSAKKAAKSDAKTEAKSEGCGEKASDCDAKAKKDCGK
jgi:hypothetical protein